MITSELQNILKRMEETIKGEPWYGRPVMELLKEVDPEHAFHRSDTMPYSIADLVAHMIYWKRYVRDVLISGVGERDQEKSYAWQNYGHPGQATWSLLLTDFLQLHRSLIDCLDNLSIDLNDMVPGRTLSYEKLLNGSVDHDIYHIGQVVVLHKILTSQRKRWFSLQSLQGLRSWYKTWGADTLKWVVLAK